MQPKDWLRIALGGDVAADPSDACATALATPDGAWDLALIDALGLPADRFAPVLPSSARCGTLGAQAAKALGLPAGVPLATARPTPCAALGSGLAAAGDALLTTGSGGQIVVLADALPPARRGLHRYRAAAGGGYYTMAAMQNVGRARSRARLARLRAVGRCV